MRIAQLLFWVVAGTVMAPLLILCLAYILEDTAMVRTLPLISVTVAGALAAMVMYRLVLNAMSPAQKTTRRLLGVLLYAFAIFIAYKIAHWEVVYGLFDS